MISLSVKYRPKIFSEVCSQISIVKILTRQLELNQFKNAYLFCGASGCGKTTMARIFASEINKGCGSPIEIDAASNNGVENIRSLTAAANERSLDSQYKIYIIDEAHALTSQAWQAFLKCIEEPPAFTVFIFCTTDPQKIPATILNRCQRFNFSRISSDVIRERLLYICQKEGFTDYSESVDYISKICNGGMRDAIALLEKCAGYSNNLNIQNVLFSLGNYSYDVFFKLINCIIDGRENEVLQILTEFYNSGNDLKLFVDQFLTFCLDLTKYTIFHSVDLLRIPSSMEEQLKNSVNFENASTYYEYVVDKLLTLKNMLKTDSDPYTSIQIYFLQLTRCK